MAKGSHQYLFSPKNKLSTIPFLIDKLLRLMSSIKTLYFNTSIVYSKTSIVSKKLKSTKKDRFDRKVCKNGIIKKFSKRFFSIKKPFL